MIYLLILIYFLLSCVSTIVLFVIFEYNSKLAHTKNKMILLGTIFLAIISIPGILTAYMYQSIIDRFHLNSLDLQKFIEYITNKIKVHKRKKTIRVGDLV